MKVIKTRAKTILELKPNEREQLVRSLKHYLKSDNVFKNKIERAFLENLLDEINSSRVK